MNKKYKFKSSKNGLTFTVPKGHVTRLHTLLSSATQMHKDWDEIDKLMKKHAKEMIHREYKNWRWNKYFSYYFAGLGLFMYTSTVTNWILLQTNTNWSGLMNVCLGMLYMGYGCLLYRKSTKKIKELFIDAL